MVNVLRGIALSTALMSGFVFAPQQASAGPLLDWLFGHRTAYYPPGYAPAAVAAPVAQTSYYAPTTSYYAPATGPVLSYRVTPYSSFYGTGNIYPSYSGNYAVASPVVPAAATLPTTSYAYPSTTALSPVTQAYSPITAYSPATAYPATAPVVSYAYPTAAPAVAPAYPVYPAYPAYRPGLLGRLFRPAWPWGYGYTSSYYPAEVTYYRPVTTLSPVTGVPVTSLSACTGTQYQIQRSPTSSLVPIMPAPAAGCDGGCGSAPAMSPYPTPAYPPTASTAPVYPGQAYGAPPSTVLPGSGASPSDIMPVPQPQLTPSNSLSPTASYYEYGTGVPSSSATITPNTSSNYSSAYPGTTSPAYPPASNYPTTQYPPATYPQTPSLAAPAPSSSSLQPLPQASTLLPQLNGTSAQPRPIPAPANPMPYFDSAADKEPRSASHTAAFKTIQWSNRSPSNVESGNHRIQEPASVRDVRNAPTPARANPVQQPKSRYDDSGWR